MWNLKSIVDWRLKLDADFLNRFILVAQRMITEYKQGKELSIFDALDTTQYFHFRILSSEGKIR